MEGAFLPKGKIASFTLASVDIELRRKTHSITDIPEKQARPRETLTNIVPKKRRIPPDAARPLQYNEKKGREDPL